MGKAFSDLDLSIEATVVAERRNLKESKALSLCRMERFLDTYPAMFNPDQIKKMHHLFKEGHFYNAVPGETSQEEIESACFPKYFVSFYSNDYKNVALAQKVKITGTKTKADGTYDVLDDDLEFFGKQKTFEGRHGRFWIRNHDGWCILFSPPGDEESGSMLWKSPNSRHLDIPPMRPWLPVEGAALGLDPTHVPVLQYVE